jgi:hypothetical protein
MRSSLVVLAGLACANISFAWVKPTDEVETGLEAKGIAPPTINHGRHPAARYREEVKEQWREASSESGEESGNSIDGQSKNLPDLGGTHGTKTHTSRPTSKLTDPQFI